MKLDGSRRDFLKLAKLFPAGFLASSLSKTFNLKTSVGKKNVIVVVFDAFSAHNISLYGYKRDTTPNINRLADRATIYHNHYAGSNFTSPGTASLLTGTLPWTHRALRPNGMVLKEYEERSIFSIFDDYYRIAYSHNEWVNTLFNQFKRDIEEWLPREQLYLFSSDSVVQKIFQNDGDVSSVAWVRNAKIADEGYAYSLVLSRLVSYFEERQIEKYKPQFPRGLPTARADIGFLLEHAIDWVIDRTSSIQQPYFGYFHFLPPHDPYRAPKIFTGDFRKDGYIEPEKPLDVFAVEEEQLNSGKIDERRKSYDEFILYVDREFGRLFDALEEAGTLEDTWLVLTSDHGELFERGITGHMTNALYQPLIKIPLLIFEPGKTTRTDIYEETSAVDLLPTFAFWADKEKPMWTEGKILPPYDKEAAKRSIYSLRSYSTGHGVPMKQASVTMVKGKYKLHYYFGYPELNSRELIKLFDIEADPEELVDLAGVETDLVNELAGELKTKLAEVDKPYL
jgi:arylsulfatase A-like enzyme